MITTSKKSIILMTLKKGSGGQVKLIAAYIKINKKKKEEEIFPLQI